MHGTLPCMSDRPVVADRLSRFLGMLVFLLGIGLIVYVFQQANVLFNAPQMPVAPTPSGPSAGTVAAPAGEALGKTAAAIGADLATFVRRLLTLLVMALAGGLVASQGVRLMGALRRNL